MPIAIKNAREYYISVFDREKNKQSPKKNCRLSGEKTGRRASVEKKWRSR